MVPLRYAGVNSVSKTRFGNLRRDIKTQGNPLEISQAPIIESHEFFLLHFAESRYLSKFEVIGFPTLFNKTINKICGFEVYSWRLNSLKNVSSLNLNYGSVREK